MFPVLCVWLLHVGRLMIPAKTTCPTAWTTEYIGYVMTARNDEGPNTFECVDQSQEPIPGTQPNMHGSGLYHVEASCNGFECYPGPYDDFKELNCAVCTI